MVIHEKRNGSVRCLILAPRARFSVDAKKHVLLAFKWGLIFKVLNSRVAKDSFAAGI